MFDFLYQSGWGAFTAMLFFQLPFIIVFLYVVYRKAFIHAGPSDTDDRRVSRLDVMWMTLTILLFTGVNVASIEYMPTIMTTKAALSGQEIQDVAVTAQSWSYQISERQLVAGQPVRFSVKSADTVHGFAVYHPDGRILFTMMMIPGMQESSIIHTFTEPGMYKVRCLEYCGIAHHLMQDELIVAASSD